MALVESSPVKPGSRGGSRAAAVPAAPSPKKLQSFDESSTAFSTSSPGTARQRASTTKKFTIDHIGVDVPDDSVLREMFEYFDSDKSGSLDASEFKRLYTESFENYGAPATQKSIDRLFAKLDRDNSGRLSYEEFCILVLNRLKA